jgi:hypothetical protein
VTGSNDLTNINTAISKSHDKKINQKAKGISMK